MIPVVHPMTSASKSRVVRLVNYVTSDQGKPERVAEVFLTNCSSPDAYIASREMEAVQCLNTRSKGDKTFHLSVSFPTGERPTSEQFKHIEEEIAKALGYKDYQRIAVVHTDTDNVHMHMVINKIHPEKNTILTVYNDHGILAKVCARLEQELSLTIDPHEPQKTNDQARIDSIERKTGVESFAGYAREHAISALDTSKTWAEFHDSLANHGIVVKLHGNGLIFADHKGEFAAKGSSVGRQFSKDKLEKQLGDFEPGQAIGEKFSIENFATTYVEKPKDGEKGLYDNFKEERAKIDQERKDRYEALKVERDQAIKEAKAKAERIIAAKGVSNLFRSNQLKKHLARKVESQLVEEAKQAFSDKRDALFAEARQGFGDWMKEQARGGSDRAAFSFFQKNEVAARRAEIAAIRQEQAEAVKRAKLNVRIQYARETTETLTDKLLKQVERKRIGPVIELHRERFDELRKNVGEGYDNAKKLKEEFDSLKAERRAAIEAAKRDSIAVANVIMEQTKPRTEKSRDWQLRQTQYQMTKAVIDQYREALEKMNAATREAFDEAKARKEAFAEFRKERQDAIEAAKTEAADEVKAQLRENPQLLAEFREDLIKREDWNATTPVFEEYKLRIENIEKQPQTTFEDWLEMPQKERDEITFKVMQEAAKQEEAKEKFSIENKPEEQGKGKETPKSLYDEYSAFREKEAAVKEAERAARLDELKKEQKRATANAKYAAWENVNSRPGRIFKSPRLLQMLENREASNAREKIYAEFKAKREELFKQTKVTGFVDWLKVKAQGGDVRAIVALRKKDEVAPELISITSRELKDAKIIAAKIEAVTGRGTLFYKAGSDVYRDDGKNISLKDDVSREGIKNALLIAAAKFNGTPLVLNGTEEFKTKCAEIARRDGLKLTFEDPKLEAIRTKPTIRDLAASRKTEKATDKEQTKQVDEKEQKKGMTR